MSFTVRERVLLSLQIVVILGIAWQLATSTGEDHNYVVVASLLSITALGIGRVRMRETRVQAQLEMVKGLQESERSAHELASHLDLSTRREIGSWIHGELQSSLIHLARSLRHDGQNEAADKLSNINDNMVRAMAHKLYPPQLEISIQLALNDLCHERAEITLSDNLSLNSFKSRESIIVPFDIRLAIHRIVEEAITNAEKKPNTSKISVNVIAENNLIRISVRDDGDALTAQPEHSLGLTLINSYVRQFNGNWNIRNSNGGVLLTAILALPVVTTLGERVNEFNSLPGKKS